ncbi:MAG: RHS repeat protein, partial [Nitrososphaerota archaeon]|nr:RHS repeat protein [Nitrososphaerota archaeon]
MCGVGITKKPAAAALIPFLLLSNLLFLIPVTPVSASTAPPAQPNGRPLPPGTVDAHNSWNLTNSCPPEAKSQPLVPLPSWSTPVSIPTLLFMGRTEGSYLVQTVNVSPGGVVSVSDGFGNSFSFTVPVGGSGQSVSTLIGNSSSAVYETKVTEGPLLLSDVRLTLSVYRRFCQPAGVRLQISGSQDWGASETGPISVVFDKAPDSYSSYRAYFGNSSGVALGFDWNDSASLNPQFSSATRTLSWTVGPSFDIDPETVSTSTSSFATAYSNQPKYCSADGRDWIFYFDGSNYVYRSASDAYTWSSATNISTSGLKAGGDIAVYCAGSAVYRATLGAGSGPDEGWYFDTGNLTRGGSIAWGTELQVESTYAPDASSGPSIAVGTTGTVYVSLASSTNSRLEVWKCSSSCLTASSWGDSHDVSGQSCSQVLPLTAGKMSLVFDTAACSTSGTVGVQTYDGSSAWSATESITSPSSILGTSSAVSSGDTTYVCAQYSAGKDAVFSLPYGGSLSSERGFTYNHPQSCSLSSGGGQDLLAFTANGGYVYYYTSSNGGSSWATATVSSTANSASWIVCPLAYSSMYVASWTEGTASPYDVVAYALPTQVPVAAGSGHSWSQPGVSPYETYFSSFGDYVSPGNGLLSVGLGTVSQAARGSDLNLDVGLVYSQPYAFTSSSGPYGYDTYSASGADLGNGWALDLPWMGASYLHLPGGQAYPYAWSNSVFEYHGAVDFKLVDNTNNGTYTLYLASGMAYSFNSAKLLVSQDDPDGNTLTFTYAGSTSYPCSAAATYCLTKISDAAGRYVSFGLSGAMLSTITYGSRTWTLSYSGSQLTSVSDPLSRKTSFSYNATAGAGSWLLGSVTFPTGGKVAYSYKSGPVGTEVDTYYVVGRTLYASSSQVVQSDSISYSVFNGAVAWSNETVSDGTNVQSQTDTYFSAANGYQRVYSYDGSNVLKGITESDFDPAGRINETKLISAAGSVLALSEYAYDNWGNQIYSKDSVGQQTWTSYSNTNSSDSLGSSGCASSFYAQTIPSYIHDLPLGQCDYQDGPASAQQETFYKYDPHGNLIEQKVSHDGGWLYTDHAYDAYGNVLSTTDADNHTTYFRYSSATPYYSTYLTKKSALAGTQNVTTTYAYDQYGDLLSTTDPNGQTTSYTYDAIGRQTSITYSAVGGVAATAYTYYYDNNDTMKTVDPDGHVTIAYFNGLARETEVQAMNGSAAFSTVYYTYNWLGEVANKTTAAGNTYTYSYDWSGRQVKLTNPDGTYETISYNDTANTKTVTDENGHRTVYSYDWDSRLTSVKEYNSSTTYYLTTYAYDLSGNMLSVTDAKGQTTSYQYDDL